MIQRSLLLGADGGGTKTLGLLADAEGTIIARAEAGPSNQFVMGLDVAAVNLAELITRCCHEGGRRPEEIGAAVIGLAGAGGDRERGELAAAVRTILAAGGTPEVPIIIESDARVALEGAFAGKPGIVAIAGTGSVVIGKSHTIVRIGGWGRVLGDEGSGYFIGQQALRSVALDIDGRGDSGTLRTKVAARFGFSTREELIAAVYRAKFDVPSVAPLVIEAAAGGDGVALAILGNAAGILAGQVGAVARRLDLGETAGVAFIGGLIDHDNLYTRLLRDAIVGQLPRAIFHPPVHGPAQGALLMAQARLKES